MNAIFGAIYREFASHTGTGTPYALTSGRMYRSFAPKSAPEPYITVTLIGGPYERFFGGGGIEKARFQIDVWDRHRDTAESTAVAMQIYEGLVTIFDDKTLTLEAVGEVSGVHGTSLLFRRDGIPQEEADDEYVHVYGDWTFERQIT